LDKDGNATPAAIRASGPSIMSGIHLVRGEDGVKIAKGDRELTPAFPEIESFDVSEERGEVVFSALREGGFDIGLVSTDGSEISWVPNDPADEVQVQWAPRGHKVSFVIRATAGDVIRTVHIPTGFALSIPLEHARVNALGWDPQAENFAVVWSSPLFSDRVDVMAYDGRRKQTVIPSAATIAGEIESFGAKAVLLRPAAVAYGERLPVVVWISDARGWSDAVAWLMSSARVALILAPEINDELRSAIAETPWMEKSPRYVVGDQYTTPPDPQTMIIAGDPALHGRALRRSEGRLSVSPAVVQSFAAGFIAEQLKRAPSKNAASH
jgi:hypothetical protein